MRQTWTWLVAVVGLGAGGQAVGQTNYYWNGVGSLTSVSSWGTSLNGSGTAPTSFTANNQVFNLQNGQSASNSSAWTISGTGSGLLLQTGSTLIANGTNHSLTLGMQSGATYSVNSTYTNLTLGTVDPGSLFIMNSANFRNLAYGGFRWNVSTGVQNPSATITYGGNLEQVGSSELRLTATGNQTVTVGRNLVIGSGSVLNYISSSGTPILNISGGLTNSGTLAATGGSGAPVVNFVGTAASMATWGTLGTIGSGTVIQYNVSDTRDLTFADNFTLATGNRLNIGSTATVRLGSGGTTGGLTGTFSSTTFVNNGTLYVNRSDTVTLGTFGGTGAVTKQGAGTLVVSGTGTSTGLTTVSAGILAGTGVVSGAVTVAPNGIVRGGAGSLNQTLTTGSLTFQNGGTLAATVGGGAANDTALTAASRVSAAAFGRDAGGSLIKLSLTSDSTTPLSDLTGAVTYTRRVATYTSLTNLTAGNTYTASSGVFTLDGTNFGIADGWSVFINGTATSGGIDVTFTPVPEPATVLAVAAAGLGLARLRRRLV